MSPEQVRSSSRVDHRTDLWSLGVIAFQCVTGRLLFPGTELGEVLVDVLTAPIPLASQAAPDLGTALDGFFQRALARDREKRFQSADELVAAFAALPGARGPEAAHKATTGTVVAPNVVAPAMGRLEATAGAGTEIALPHDAALPGIGTLSPAAQTKHDARLPSRGGSSGILIGVGVAAALGIGLFAFMRGPSSSSDAPAVSSTPAPASPPPASPAPGIEPQAPAPSSALTADALPSASASAIPTSKPTVKPRRPSPAPSKKKDDLLKHM